MISCSASSLSVTPRSCHTPQILVLQRLSGRQNLCYLAVFELCLYVLDDGCVGLRRSAYTYLLRSALLPGFFRRGMDYSFRERDMEYARKDKTAYRMDFFCNEGFATHGDLESREASTNDLERQSTSSLFASKLELISFNRLTLNIYLSKYSVEIC